MISTARLAGFVYLAHGLTGMFSIIFVPSQLFVFGDGQATFDRILASPVLFNLGLASGLVSQILFVCVPLLLYPVLARHGRIAAGLMAAFVCISVPLFFSASAELYAISQLMAHAGVATPEQIMGHIEQHQRGLQLTSIFWGLWLIPFGYLVLVSGAIPRAIGGLLILGGGGYLLNVFGPLLIPSIYNGDAVFIAASLPSTFGELGAMLWLALMGARDPGTTLVPPLQSQGSAKT